MAGVIRPEDIIGTWAHAHEEDAAGQTVFRRGVRLPPSRGRRLLEFRPEGELREGGPGPDDRSRWQAGSWVADGQKLILRMPGRPDEVLDVADFGADRMVVQRR
jgi:hypothetical protein